MDHLILVGPARSVKPIATLRRETMIGAPVSFGPGKHSGTFSGVALKGPAVHGSFTC